MNPEASVSSLIRFSWDKTKAILFPFKLKRWLRILVIVWLSGHAAGAGGNLNVPRQTKPQQEQTQAQTSTQSPAQAQDQAQGEKENEGSETAGIPQTGPRQIVATPALPTRVPPVFFVIIIPLVIFLVLLFLWLSARFSFIFLDLMVRGEPSIKEGFRTFRSLGNSFFRWSLGFAAIGICGLLIPVLIGAALWSFAKWLLFLLIPLTFLFVLAFVLIGVLTGDFVLPIMYRDGVGTMAGWKRFLSLRPAFGQIALYLLIIIGLGIAAGILALIAAIAIGIVAVLIGLVIALPGALMVNAVPFLKPILIVLGVLAAIALIVFLILLMGLLTLPIPIFFRAFALSYLVRFGGQYNLLGYPFSGPETVSGD